MLWDKNIYEYFLTNCYNFYEKKSLFRIINNETETLTCLKELIENIFSS